MRKNFYSTREGLARNREVRRRLGEALRAAYESALSQSLPDHLADLLNRLKKREGETSSSRSSPSKGSDP
jgi:hypothetical protein